MPIEQIKCLTLQLEFDFLRDAEILHETDIFSQIDRACDSLRNAWEIAEREGSEGARRGRCSAAWGEWTRPTNALAIRVNKRGLRHGNAWIRSTVCAGHTVRGFEPRFAIKYAGTVLARLVGIA